MLSRSLKTAKINVLRAMRYSALDRRVLNSKWRQRRLAVLCFHGVSTADEHECFPNFFITQEILRQKLRLIQQLDMTVLRLSEAVERLKTGTLPKRSVVITIDDGFYGAYAKGAPVIAEFGYPATIYQTTHYVNYNRPVFDNMCSYLLWKGIGSELRWDGVLDSPVRLDSSTRFSTMEKIAQHALTRRLTSVQKDELLAELAAKLGIDYDALCRKRMFHLVNPDEIRSWDNVEFELHTHRHRVARNKALFTEQLVRNARELQRITGRESRHFAYPGGAYLPEFPAWLRELGLKSATTCVSGMATAGSDPFLLPRIMDTSGLSIEELGGWLSGAAALLPVRSYPLDTSQLLQEEHVEPYVGPASNGVQ